MDTLATPELPGPRVAVLVGRPGFGKTTRALERWFTWPRAVAIDTKTPERGFPPDYPGLVAWTPRELTKLLRENVDKARFRIVYRGQMEFPNPHGPGTTIEPVFNALADIPDCLFTVDETDKWTTATYTPGKPDGGLYAMVHHGRTRGQAVTLCARRAAALPRDLTGSVEEFWAWPLEEPADRDYLKQRGFPLDVLDSLGKYEALVKRTPPGERASFAIVG